MLKSSVRGNTTMNETHLAPCGMNCAVCYAHLRPKKPCPGCRQPDANTPNHCRTCNIKACATEHEVTFCGDCDTFPCKLIKRLDASYRKRYDTSLIENARRIKAEGISAFLQAEQRRWTCSACNGVISLHDRVCSQCGQGDTNA